MPEFWVVIVGFFTALVMSLLTGFYRLQWSRKDALPVISIACSCVLLSAFVDDAIAEMLEVEQRFVTVPLMLILIIGGLTLYKEMRV